MSQTKAQLIEGSSAQDIVADDVQISSINGGPLAGFRNAIINGNFDIWQRGTSQSAGGYGSADRWFTAVNISSMTASRQAFALGQTAVPSEPTFFGRWVASSVANAAAAVLAQQKIEGVRTFAGQQVTVSFWAKADATKNIAVEFAQVFGTGGSPSAEVTTIGTVKKQLSTSWQKITHTATIPSISGKTLGSDNNDSLYLNIWFDAGSNFNSRTDTLGQQSGTFDIAQVQIEAGPVATPFERRPIGTELALCQRYFEVLAPSAVMFPWANTAQIIRSAMSFSVAKRATPTITMGTKFSGTGTMGVADFNQFGVIYSGVGSQQDVVMYTGNTASAEL
jgi:hypothetical protein